MNFSYVGMMGEYGGGIGGRIQPQALNQPPRPVDAADEQYVRAKTSVWWDIENCPVLKSCEPHSIAQNVSSALFNLNYCGPLSISAYGDTTRISQVVQRALNSTGISLNHVPAGVKDASDKKILVDMLLWAVDNPAPANYLLISGDRDFSNALHQLRMRRYNILLAQPPQASAPLVAAAKSIWLWSCLSFGGPPRTSADTKSIVNNGFVFGSNSQSPVDGSAHEEPHVGQLKRSKLCKLGMATGCKSLVKNPLAPTPRLRKEMVRPGRRQRKRARREQRERQERQGHQPPTCMSCQTPHFGQCRQPARKCYMCGMKGHFIKSCDKYKEGQCTPSEAAGTMIQAGKGGNMTPKSALAMTEAADGGQNVIPELTLANTQAGEELDKTSQPKLAMTEGVDKEQNMTPETNISPRPVLSMNETCDKKQDVMTKFVFAVDQAGDVVQNMTPEPVLALPTAGEGKQNPTSNHVLATTQSLDKEHINTYTPSIFTIQTCEKVCTTHEPMSTISMVRANDLVPKPMFTCPMIQISDQRNSSDPESLLSSPMIEASDQA